MQFGCAIFLATVVGVAGAILVSLSLLFWHARTPRDLQRNKNATLMERLRRSPAG
jgi:hypothetical protein